MSLNAVGAMTQCTRWLNAHKSPSEDRPASSGPALAVFLVKRFTGKKIVSMRQRRLLCLLLLLVVAATGKADQLDG
jgi:hypothetical protein